MSKVRCSECGYLAVRDGSDQFREASIGSREKGHIIPGYWSLPYCFIAAIRIDKENSKANDDESRFLNVINTERDCQGFVTWKQGFSPKEHIEMLLLKEQREWQESCRMNDLAWQQAQELERRTWQEQQQKKDQAWQTEQNAKNRRWGMISSLVAVVIGAGLGLLLNWISENKNRNGQSSPSVPTTTMPDEKPPASQNRQSTATQR